MGRHSSFVAITLLVCALSACGNPRTGGGGDGTPQNNSNGTNTESAALTPTVTLRPNARVGDRFRTTRNLKVEELTETERYVTESEEVTLTEVLRADGGRLLSVRRTWEASVTRLTSGFGEPEVARGDLDGCTLELTQKANGVEAVLLTGDVDIRGANFLIEGFDTGLLPLDPVRVNDYWQLEGSRLGGLNRFVEAMGLVIEKNKLVVQLERVTDSSAWLGISWSLSGELGGVAAVLEFSGGIVFDRKTGMITSFNLAGGRQGDDRRKQQQIEISITRRAVTGWLDLER